MKCRTCARRLDLERLDYTKGCKHEQMEGFVCLACAFEGVAYWMTNISEDDYCEEYVEKQVKGDLISRQKALDALGEEPPVWYDGEDEIAERDQWRRDVAAIEALPSANKSGHWMMNPSEVAGDGYYICSNCNNDVYDATDFCPNCGSYNGGESNG